MNRISIALKYNGRVLNENDLVTSLGKENNYDIQVEIKNYGNSFSSYISPGANPSVSGITHASPQSLTNDTSSFQVDSLLLFEIDIPVFHVEYMSVCTRSLFLFNNW